MESRIKSFQLEKQDTQSKASTAVCINLVHRNSRFIKFLKEELKLATDTRLNKNVLIYEVSENITKDKSNITKVVLITDTDNSDVIKNTYLSLNLKDKNIYQEVLVGELDDIISITKKILVHLEKFCW